MYLLLRMVIFQPVMLVFKGGTCTQKVVDVGFPHRFARWNNLQPCLHDLLELLMFQSIGKQVTFFFGMGNNDQKIGMTKNRFTFVGPSSLQW